MIQSAIYDAQVRHRRRTPAHELNHRLRLAYLDVEELPQVACRRRGWSTGPAPVWFRRRDYLDGTERPIREVLTELILERTGRRIPGPVAILTQLRTLGWLFNPLTTYYCFESDGDTLFAVVLEITNTPWHERFWYVLDADQVAGRGLRFAKQFHVSPLLPMDLAYRCRAPVPGERLALRFELSAAGSETGPQTASDRRAHAEARHGSLVADGPGDATRDCGPARVFDADLTGRRVPLDAPITARATVRGATQTALVSAGIYANAAVLRARGAPFHRHPERHVVPGSPAGAGAFDPRSLT